MQNNNYARASHFLIHFFAWRKRRSAHAVFLKDNENRRWHNSFSLVQLGAVFKIQLLENSPKFDKMSGLAKIIAMNFKRARRHFIKIIVVTSLSLRLSLSTLSDWRKSFLVLKSQST